MAKRKRSEVLEIRNDCRKKEGVAPGQKETTDQKARIEACVLRRTGKK